MSRLRVLGVALVMLTATACPGGDDTAEAAEELRALATASDTLTYSVTYRFELSGPLAEAVETKLRLVQQPPTTWRKVETTTVGAGGEPVTTEAWYIQSAPDESLACTHYEDGVRCTHAASFPGLFNLRQVDEFFSLPRQGAALPVVEASDPRMVIGEEATCYVAGSALGSPRPERSPDVRFVPETHRYEFCYSQDGILLAARRVIADDEVPEDIESEGRREARLVATAVSRTVEPGAVEPPGQVVEPSALRDGD